MLFFPFWFLMCPLRLILKIGHYISHRFTGKISHGYMYKPASSCWCLTLACVRIQCSLITLSSVSPRTVLASHSGPCTIPLNIDMWCTGLTSVGLGLPLTYSLKKVFITDVFEVLESLMPWLWTCPGIPVYYCISQGGLTYIRYIIGQVKNVIIKFQIFTSDAFDQDFDVKTVNRVKK